MKPNGDGNVPFSKLVFDGKRMRKAIQRRTVDYNQSLARWMQVACPPHSSTACLFLNKKPINTLFRLLLLL